MDADRGDAAWHPRLGPGGGPGDDGSYFRKFANAEDVFYQAMSGGAAFTLLGPATAERRVHLPIACLF